MQLKNFTGFDAAEARRKIAEWRKRHPQARIVREKEHPPYVGVGRLEGKQVFRVEVVYEGEG
jgi:hypothetical protein